MSLASSIGLNPKNPVVITTTSTLSPASPAFIGAPQSFTPTISATAPYVITAPAGLTSISLAQWNALTTSGYTLSGRANNTSVVYEKGAFTGGSSSTAQTLNYEASPLVLIGGIAQTNNVDIQFIIPTIV